MVAAQRQGIRMKLHIGTMGWSYIFWKGNFYPEMLPSKKLLAYYSRQFNTVEVNSTFYRIPLKQTIVDWYEQTPSEFLFSLKFPRIITHIKMLEKCQEETSLFLERVKLLKEKLGVLLLQFPYKFGNEKVTVLHEFLKRLPKDLRYAVEIRNRKLLNENLYSILSENDVALTWEDTPFMPIIDKVTSDFFYLRWKGDRRQVEGIMGKVEVNKYEKTRLWADKVKPFLDKQTEIFGYFSKYYSGHPPSDVYEFLKIINEGKQN